MRGFCKSGILLLPKVETWTGRSADYDYSLNKSIKKAVEFFAKRDIKLQCFTTNDLAIQLKPEGIEWVNCSTPEDIHFIKNNCEGMSILPTAINLDEIHTLSRSKFPIKRGLGLEERFDIVMKRDKFAANKYISEQKFVITMEHQNNPYYKVKEKEGDGRIVFRVNHSNFVVQASMSGTPIDIIYLVEYRGASKPLYNWEV